MSVFVAVWLFLATPALGLEGVPSYTPQLLNKTFPGTLTSTAFMLHQPQCIFNNYSRNEVWLVVAESNGSATLSDKMLSVPVNYSTFSVNQFYHTLRVFGSEFPCQQTKTNTMAILQVGSENNCSGNPFCNAPLPSPGSYKVKFVVLNNTGLVTATNWSDRIQLETGQNFSTTDTWHGRRSGGMIVITTILSVLMSILLACLIVSIIVGSKNIFWHKTLNTDKVGLEGPRRNQESYRNIYQHDMYMVHNLTNNKV